MLPPSSSLRKFTPAGLAAQLAELKDDELEDFVEKNLMSIRLRGPHIDDGVLPSHPFPLALYSTN